MLLSPNSGEIVMEQTIAHAKPGKLQALEQESLKRRQAEQFAEAVLNSLSAHITIIDENGFIVKTNKAWKEFAQANQIKMRPDTIGVNYIQLCESARGDHFERSVEVANGMRAVIAGEAEEFVIDYACHSPEEKRWFYLRVTTLSEAGSRRIVVSHENITALKLTEEALGKRENELEVQARNLEETNTALKVLLRQREEDKQELEQNILANVNNFIMPYFLRLQKTRLDPQQRMYLEVIQSHIKEISSSFSQKLTLKHLNLTPQEMQVAVLVKDGKATKEIAEILNISKNAVDFHRKGIRRKVGITNKKQT